MARYPVAVELAWGVVEQFIRDWQRTPGMWWYEADAQAEIAVRLRTMLRTLGTAGMRVNYPSGVPEVLQERDFILGRVGCNAPVGGKDGFGAHSKRPDVVLYRELKNDTAPPDLEETGRWPMEWACEIKYASAPFSDIDRHPDVVKLRDLLEEDMVDYGVFLEFVWKRPEADGQRWHDWKPFNGCLGSRLWVYQAFLSRDWLGDLP